MKKLFEKKRILILLTAVVLITAVFLWQKKDSILQLFPSAVQSSETEQNDYAEAEQNVYIETEQNSDLEDTDSIFENNFTNVEEKNVAGQEKIEGVAEPDIRTREEVLLEKNHLPDWVTWQEKTFPISEEENIEAIELLDARILVRNASEVVWQTGDEILVQDFLWCDIDRDASDELVILCWKPGLYGEHKPFWKEENTQEYSQHIFIYDWTGEEMYPLWMASDPGVDIAKWCYDSHDYLMVENPEGVISGWAWLSWGLEGVDTSVDFAAVGDDLIHMQIVNCGRKENNYDFMFEHVKDEIQATDIAIINQETMLVDDPSQYSDFPRFGSPVEISDAIKNAGFDVVTCATNHSLDKGMSGINTTQRALEEKGLCVLGINAGALPYKIVVNKRIRFALMNYTYGTNGMPLPADNPNAVMLLTEEEKIRKDIRMAKEASDVVILFVHWGTEYQKEPDEFQQKWKDIFLEEGVNVVVGTHPHVLEPYELCVREDGHKMLVYYSLGNYISAQDTLDTVLGGFAKFTVGITLDGCQILEYDLLPLVTHQESGNYTTYFLDDYTDALASKHRLAEKGLTIDALKNATLLD